MFSARNQLRENLVRVRELGGLATAIQSITTGAIDVSDIYRSQIVLAVSALDSFVHDLVLLGMIECAKGKRPRTDAYLRFELPMSAAEAALGGSAHEIWVGESVRQRHSWQSFQEPDRVADAIRLISPSKLWDSVGTELNEPAKDLKVRLKIIVDRRNKIAHEADLDPANPGFRWPISRTDVTDTVDFIERLADAIFKATN